MNILTYGEIIENGKSIFSVIAKMDDDKLIVKFEGELRSEHPLKDLEYFMESLEPKAKENEISKTEIDFTELKFCSSNGFYVVMDILEAIFNNSTGDIYVKRLSEDDWHQETLPVLLNIDDKGIAARVTVENCA
jgi:anti-anti-sigma regulatory factor